MYEKFLKLNMKKTKHKKPLTVVELKRLYTERWHYPPKLPAKKIRYTACGKKPLYGLNEKPIYEPCWKHPLEKTQDAQLGPCWEYPPERYKRRPLPPKCRGASIPIEKLVPVFEHCSALYTRYDYRLEQCVHQQILRIQKLFRKLEKLLEKIRPLQIEQAEEMRNQAMRYRILVNGACCTKIYPEYLSRLTEDRALCDYQKAYNVINESNREFGCAVIAVRNALPELRERISKLDHTQKSIFLLGDGYGNPSLYTVVEMIEDLYDYFFGVARKLTCWAQLMDPGHEFSIEDYLALLHDKSDFETFMQAGTEKCTCKRCDNKNPFVPYLPCWCQPRDVREERLKERQSYRCPVNLVPKFEPGDSEYVPEASSTSLLEAELKRLSERKANRSTRLAHSV